MREIRFRLWDTDNKSWYKKDTRTDDKVPLALMHNGKGEHFINTWLIVEQFTGLKDSEGKEIYEGDIIRDRLVQRTVFWDKEYAGFSPFCFYDTVKLFNGEERRFDLIGNIHETPELLK